MLPKAALVFLVLICASPSHGAELYRWTDEMGRVHFGDSPPGTTKNKAKAVDLKSSDVSPEEAQAARARLEKEKARLNQPSPRAALLPEDKTPASDQEGGKESSCAEQWAKYDESWACFNPYRIQGGAVKEEAFAHCTEIKTPSCVLPDRRQ